MKVSPHRSLAAATFTVFDIALGQMLWSRRSFFLAVVTGGPVLVALAVRLIATAVSSPFPSTSGAEVAGPAIFGIITWMLFVKFLVPLLGLFYGTALIADEVDDKTITYLFVRPIPRRAVLLGKYIAYMVCTILLVLPALVAVYFLVVPIGGGRLGATWPLLVADLGALGLGLAAYGAVFGYIGAALKRPVVAGLVFVFGWEPIVQVMPGYLKRLTVSHYVQALVPHPTIDLPDGGLMSWLSGGTPGVAASALALAAITLAGLVFASWTVERREYVLDR